MNPSWMLVLPIVMCLADAGITLALQPATYWRGEYVTVVEWSPLPRVLLQDHPLLFLGGVVCWVVVFTTVIRLARTRVAVDLCLVVAAGHTVGVFSWLRRLDGATPVCVVLLVTVMLAAIPTWRLPLPDDDRSPSA